MAWLGPGGQAPVFSPSNNSATRPTFPNSLVTHVTAQALQPGANDVQGVVKLTTDSTGVAASTLITTIAFPVALPTDGSVTVQLTPQDASSALAGGAAAAGWSAGINSSGQLVINTGVATAASAKTYTLAYFIIGGSR